LAQSAARNFFGSSQNFDLGDPGGRPFSDLVDGDGEVYGLGLMGSGYVMDVSVTY
jgi:hypothetical protein